MKTHINRTRKIFAHSACHCITVPLIQEEISKHKRFVDSIERNPIKWRNQLVIENVVQIQCSIYAKM